MAAPNYEQIQSFGNVTEQLRQSAVSEFMEYLYDGISREEVIDVAVGIATKYSMLGSELGAQWYDLCSELAGLDVEPAELYDGNIETLETRAESFADSVEAESPNNLGEFFNSFLQNEINESIRMTGSANLWRDYDRGRAPGKWSRVTVGDTCAWCMMLASNGAWYVSEKSALGADPDHYHKDCNCIAVFHADAESINGYSKQLNEHKRAYYDADNARIANANGRVKYPEELQERVNAARAAHQAKYEAGETDKPWTVYHEDLIVMRYNNDLK